jgi:Fic family protein
LIADGVSFPLKELEDVRRLYDFLMRVSLNKVERPDTALFRNKPHVEDDIRLSFIPKGDEIKYALKEALSIFDIPELNIFVKLALFDFFFEYAHPFNAKNNRMLRFVDSYYIHKNISAFYCFFLSQCEEKSLSPLKKAFRLSLNPRNRSDLTTFCNAFLAVLSAEYDERIYALRRQKQRVERLQKRYTGLLEEPLLNFLVDGTAFLPCGVSAYDLASLGEVSSRTILRSLSEAKKKGLIVEHPLGKTIHYTLKDQ